MFLFTITHYECVQSHPNSLVDISPINIHINLNSWKFNCNTKVTVGSAKFYYFKSFNDVHFFGDGVLTLYGRSQEAQIPLNKLVSVKFSEISDNINTF